MKKMDLKCEKKKCSNLDKETGYCKILNQEDGLKRKITCAERIFNENK